MIIANKHMQVMAWDMVKGYGNIFFAAQWYICVVFMAATFVIPEQGLAGLAGLVLTHASAIIMGMPREHIKQGYYACNGLLVGLALGLTYRLNPAFLVMLLLASITCAFLAATVRTLYDKYIGTPSLSVPFVLTTWIAIAAGRQFSGLMYTLEPYEVSFLLGQLPCQVEFVCRSIGAALFQLSLPSGFLITVGLFLFSRYAFILAISGLAVGSFLHIGLGGRPQDLEGGWIGFNYALTAIALGGVWAAPRPASYVLAMVGAAICSVIAAGSVAVFKTLELPLLAFPFVITTTLVLFSIKHRERKGSIQLALTPAETPEQNLKRVANLTRRRLSADRPAFELPFHGEWTVTQGFDGQHTHQGLWAHAWDFEVIGDAGKPFRNDGSMLEDYLVYKLPVLAPGDGKVVRVVDHVADNPIGHVNTRTNWGNAVVIWHYDNVYSAVCHLAHGETIVKEGAHVRSGQIIGRVGSSGWSPRPHLHFQAQMGPDIGAPTLDSELLHYIVNQGSENTYITRGAPQEGASLKAFSADPTRFEAASFPLGRLWRFAVQKQTEESEEIWRSEIDFWGVRYLTCMEKRAKLKIYVDKYSLISLDYSGPTETALWWFYLAAPRIPFTTIDVAWTDSLPPDLLLKGTGRHLFDLLEVVAPLADLKTKSRFTESDTGVFTVETCPYMSGPLRWRHSNLRLQTKFDASLGPVAISAKSDQRSVVDVRQIPFATHDPQTDLVPGLSQMYETFG